MQSDYGKITGYAEDSENCRPSTERPMQLGPLFDTQSDCSGKVKPKVELRGSIMALSNTGGRRIPGPLMGAEKNGKDDAFAGVGKYDIYNHDMLIYIHIYIYILYIYIYIYCTYIVYKIYIQDHPISTLILFVGNEW